MLNDNKIPKESDISNLQDSPEEGDMDHSSHSNEETSEDEDEDEDIDNTALFE